MGLFDIIKSGLQKTRDALVSEVNSIMGSGKLTDEMLDELEEKLIRADIGVESAFLLTDALRDRALGQSMNGAKALQLLSEISAEMLMEPALVPEHPGVHVILVIGVNGAGKTTTIGKLAHHYKSQGKKVMLAAGDTFRAAAIEQLEAWAERADVPIVRHKENADSAAVAYDALESAQARGMDILIVDTAGRLHNKEHLMQELAKMLRVIQKVDATAPHETLLVIDGTTGQNAINQAKGFNKDVPLTGLVVTKLDGTAKGGSVLAVSKQLNLPVRWLGVGEQMDQLVPFSKEAYLSGLFGQK